MQTTSALYKSLLSDPNARREFRVVIAGADHGMDEIVTMSTASDLFPEDTMGIGGAAAKEIDLALRLPGTIPRMARMVPSYRLVKGDQASEWIQKGVFYIDTRSTDEVTGVVTIHGYDDMLKAEQVWEPDQSLEFPMTMQAAAQVIAGLMGVTIDPRTSLSTSYTIDYPANNYTLRDVLRYIAVAHAGNWVITDGGQLRLVSFSQTPADTVDLGYRMAQLDTSPALEQITQIILAVDSETAYIAGDDTGRTLQVTCPYGTQEMANNLLSVLSACTYTPAMAQDAMLDPAAEIGDGLTLGDVDTILAQSVLTFDGLMTSDAGAPGQAAQESEYIYQSPVLSDIDWQLAQTRSLIAKSSSQVLISVDNKVQEMETKVDVKLNSLSLSVTNEGTTSLIRLMSDDVLISSGEIVMSGIVTFAGLANGTTTVDGSCIKTGTISADRIDVSNLKFDTLWASDTKPAIYSSGDSIYIGGKTSADTFSNLYLYGTTITLSRWSTSSAGVIVQNGTSSYKVYPATSNIYSLGDSTHLWTNVYTNSVNIVPNSASLSGMTLSYAGIIPARTDYMDLGSSTYNWRYVYAESFIADGVTLDPSMVAYSSTVYASMNSAGAFIPRSGTGYSLGSSSYYWDNAYISTLRLSSSVYLSASGSDLTVNGSVIGGTNFAGKNVTMGGSTSYYIICDTSRFLRPASSSTTYPCYLGASNYYWHYAYIGSVSAKIGSSSSSRIGFFAASPIARLTLSTYSNNQGYSSATSSNYLYVLNNIAGILRKYGLIG